MKKTKSIIAGTVMAGTMALQATNSNAQGPLAVNNSSAETRPFHVSFPKQSSPDLPSRWQMQLGLRYIF